MKRVYFFLENKGSFRPTFLFALRFLCHGVTLRCFDRSGADNAEIKPGTLLCTDSRAVYNTLRERNLEVLVLVGNQSMMDLFPDAKYFVIDPLDVEFDYFERIYRRFFNIPWDIAKTKHLRLRESVEDDVEDFVRIYSEPGMTEYTEELYRDPGEERNYIKEYREKVYGVQGFGIWTVLHRKTGKVIGRAGLSARVGFEGVEVGFVIEKAMQNRGYATEAVSEIVKLADKMSFDRVFALVVKENKASVRVLEKCGFIPTGDTVSEGRNYMVYTRAL